jgi:hypothetical protein
MSVKRTTTKAPRQRFDARKIAAYIASLAVGHIRQRTGEGLDVDDRPFAAYSQEYAETRRLLGRNTGSSDLLMDGNDIRVVETRGHNNVDLLMTGGLLNDVRVVEKSGTRDVAEVTVGVGAGTSRRVRRPTKKNKRRPKRTSAPVVEAPVVETPKRRTAARGPPHNLLARWHNEGSGRNKKREWFGVSPDGQKMIDRETQRLLEEFLENK